MALTSLSRKSACIVIGRQRRTLTILRYLLALFVILTLVLGTPSPHDSRFESNILTDVRFIAPSAINADIENERLETNSSHVVLLPQQFFSAAISSIENVSIAAVQSVGLPQSVSVVATVNPENLQVIKKYPKRLRYIGVPALVRHRKPGKPKTKRNPGDRLHYGIEIAYLFPIELYRRTASHETRSSDSIFLVLTRKALRKLVQKLKEAGVPTLLSTGEAPVSGLSHRWKLQQERHGFEIASPLSPTFQEIKVVLTVLQDFGCFVHPDFTAMHINIDAHGRSISETRNVYKNMIAVESALDLLRFTNQSARSGGEANGMSVIFDSLEEAYESLDNATSFQSLLRLGLEETRGKGNVIPRLRSTYIVGMRLKQNGTLPRTFEFRGLESSLDPSVPISWLKLCLKLTQTSYEGTVLLPIEMSTEEAWSALFSELVRESVLQDYFRHRSNIIRKAHQRPDVLAFNEDFLVYRHMKVP